MIAPCSIKKSMNVLGQRDASRTLTFYRRFQEFLVHQKSLSFYRPLRHLFRKVENRIRLIRAQRAPMILWLIIGRSRISRLDVWTVEGRAGRRRKE